MAIITFLSDFGTQDHYVAAVKAKILSKNPGIQIVDISHQVPSGHIAYGAFLLKSVYKLFPPGTVHLVAIDDPYEKPSDMVAVKMENHYFLGADNGLLGLVSDTQNHLVAGIQLLDKSTTFPCLEYLAPAAAHLASGADFNNIGNHKETFKKMLGRHLRATKAQIIGHVIHVDHYGNLITNIDKTTFLHLSNGRAFQINFGRETTNKINDGYYSVEPGDCFVVFNQLGLIEIGIKQGKATKLLGLGYDSTVIINFPGT